MTVLRFLVTSIIAYVAYGVYVSHYDLRVVFGEMTLRESPLFHDYQGVVNVHSNLSTGSGSISDIVEAAQQSELDFIFITDLNQFDLSTKTQEGYHDNLLVMVDSEYSYLNSRILNFGVPDKRNLDGPGRAQVFFADLLNQKKFAHNEGALYLAHPLKPKYAWQGEYPAGLHGIEIINLKSVWQNGWLSSRWSFLWSLLIFPFNDRLALLRLFSDPREEVALWDELNKKNPTAAIAGADAEANIRVSNNFSLRFPSYHTLFSLVRNHVLLTSELTGDAPADRKKILEALRKGQFYMSLDILGNPQGFYCAVVNANKISYPPGSALSWAAGLDLIVRLPQKPKVPFEVEIYKDGKRIAQTNSLSTQFPLHGPGVYRVKVRVIPTLPLPDGKKWIPWIYSNPIYVN